MEDQVPFKVYTIWKWGSHPEVRRFGVDRNVVSSYTYLLAKIHDMFPKLKDKNFNLSWKDEEGDYVKISSDDDVMTMLTAAPGQLFKLHVHVQNKTCGVDVPHVINIPFAPPQAPTVNPMSFVLSPHAAHPALHRGVVCDSCNGTVVGFRYKCITCEDFDLCSNCESHGKHSNHCVVRIPNPQISLQVVKESIKRSRSFLKTFAASLHDAQKTQKAEMKKGGCPAAAATSGCPMSAHHAPKLEAKLAAKERREERREERQEKRQEKHEKRQERREEERREKRENPREQFSWMDIFTKYVDHFANVAADHVRVSTSDSAEQTPHPEFEMVFDPAEFAKVMDRCMNMHNSRRPSDEMMSQAGGSQESPRDSEQAPADKPASAPSTSQAASQEAPTTPQAETQAPAAPQVAPRTATTPQAPAQAAATSQAPAQAPATPLVPTQAPATPQAPTTAPVTPQVAPTPVQPVEVAKSDSPDNSSVSSAEGTIRETSPDKSAEGWTMINAEKDLEAETGAANPALMDANLPEEFRARAGAGFGFIYPPLNVATAVYDPQDPVVPAKAEAPALAPTKAPTVQYPHVYNGSTGFSPRHGPTAQPENGFMGQAGTGFTGQTGNGFFAKPGFGPVQPGLGTTGQHGFYPGPAFTGPSGQTTFPGPSFGAPASQAKPTQSPPPAAAAPKPSAPVVEQRQHRVPHIDAAIRQMIAMGFTNEGGWLTQLVESKDGNIAAVLDLLTPVKPTK